MALGAQRTLNEAVQGDVGWPSFQSRETGSNIELVEKLMVMEGERLAGRIYKYMYTKSMSTG